MSPAQNNLRSRYIQGLPAIELWGVSHGQKETTSKGCAQYRSEESRARRRMKKNARILKKTLKAWLEEAGSEVS